MLKFLKLLTNKNKIIMGATDILNNLDEKFERIKELEKKFGALADIVIELNDKNIDNLKLDNDKEYSYIYHIGGMYKGCDVCKGQDLQNRLREHLTKHNI